jgi:acyl-coenzyme A thioesterase PaaI-like protein
MVTLPIANGGPEATFGVHGITIEGNTTRGSMLAGDHLKDARGAIGAGSLGVFADNLLGYAIMAPRSGENIWSVSTEIALDILPALQHPTTGFHGEAEAVQFDELAGYARGRIVNDAGELVAVGSQRGRYLPRPASITLESGTATSGDSLEQLLEAVVADGAVVLTVAPPVQNPLRNLHGGIALCASDLAAAAIAAPLRPVSIRIVYLRPVRGGTVVEFRATEAHRGRTFGLIDVVGSVEGTVVTRAQITAGPAY